MKDLPESVLRLWESLFGSRHPVPGIYIEISAVQIRQGVIDYDSLLNNRAPSLRVGIGNAISRPALV